MRGEDHVESVQDRALHRDRMIAVAAVFARELVRRPVRPDGEHRRAPVGMHGMQRPGLRQFRAASRQIYEEPGRQIGIAPRPGEPRARSVATVIHDAHHGIAPAGV